MRDVRHTAIVVKAADYKESDKTIRLFTLDGGIIQAVLKGVKKPGAKLKFAAQPFAFCEFSLTERNGFYTVTGAVPSESFYALSGDHDSFVCASLMLEASDRAVSTVPSPAVFVYLLKLFKAILYGGASPYVAAALLLTRLTENAGYATKNLPGATPESLPEAALNPEYAPLLKKAIRDFEKYFDATLVSARLIT